VKTVLLVIIAAVMLLAFTYMVDTPKVPNQSIQAEGNVMRLEGLVILDGVSRFEDAEAGVICWVYTQAYRGGISCLPKSETLLGGTK
jgi:hypothetical protein